MSFDVSDKAKQALAGSLGDGDAVKLPFSTAVFWAHNGNQALAQIGGVSAFGGWAVAQEDFVAHMHSLGFEIPSALQLTQFTGNDGAYMVYASRAIAVAPIAYRKRNVAEDPTKFRSHVQLLGYGAIPDGSVMRELGPIVLTGKGYQASNITRAFQDWERKSAESRRAHANGVDAKLFYLPVGTFGDTPNFVKVGKGNAQSSITPVEPQIPETITPAHLKARFVGAEVADKMAEMKEQAQAWLKDWSKDNPQSDAPPAPDNFVPDEELPF